MTTYLCQACATQYPPSDAPPAACPICEDPRQYIPHDTGQVWVTWEELVDGHEAETLNPFASQYEGRKMKGIQCSQWFPWGNLASPLAN